MCKGVIYSNVRVVMKVDRFRRALVFIDLAVAPVVTFAAIYLAALAIFSAALRPHGSALHQTVAFFSATVATAGSVALFDRRSQWLVVAPRQLLRQCGFGVALAAALILAADLLVQIFGDHSRSFSGGFAAREIFWVLVVAAAHEELLFRGFIFSRLQKLSVGIAIAATSLIFAAMHAGNTGLNSIGAFNLLLGGVLLGLLRALAGTIWLPLAFHWGWNAVSGSLLGYEVSGFRMEGSLFAELDRGPELVTGGTFGIEGSIFVTLVTSVAVVIAAARLRANGRRGLEATAPHPL